MQGTHMTIGYWMKGALSGEYCYHDVYEYWPKHGQCITYCIDDELFKYTRFYTDYLAFEYAQVKIAQRTVLLIYFFLISMNMV